MAEAAASPHIEVGTSSDFTDGEAKVDLVVVYATVRLYGTSGKRMTIAAKVSYSSRKMPMLTGMPRRCSSS